MNKSYEMRVATASFAVIAGLGLTACSGENPKTEKLPVACSTPQPLDEVRIIGGSKQGGVNVVNAGECVAVYNRRTLSTIDTIPAEHGFLVVCADAMPNSFNIVTEDGLKGGVKYSDEFKVVDFTQGNTPLIPACK